MKSNRVLAIFLGLLTVTFSAQISLDAQVPAAPAKQRPKVEVVARARPRWFESAAAIHRVTLKPNTPFWKYEHLSLDRQKSEEQLRHWKEQGLDAIEIFAPAEGGNSYNGLDAINRIQLDRGMDSMDELRNLVRKAHELGLAVITFDNLGYSSIYAPQFLKACEDVRAGRDTHESRMFIWSDKTDAPPPTEGNSYYLLRPGHPNYDAVKGEFWQWDDQCQRAYWTKWAGKDAQGNPTRLPQYNWLREDWPEEAEKVVRFWMDTGLDGMIVDAVNWYVGYTWEKGNRRITDVIQSYGGNKFSQPEGGGAFHSDDPVGWITDGHWTNLQDYGLGIWWEKDNNPLVASVEKSDSRLLETALRNYHDRVVAAGGSLYATVPNMHDPEKQQFVEALLAASGDLVCYCSPTKEINGPAPGIPGLLKEKAKHPALYQNSQRRQIPTNDDGNFYAFLRTSADRSERILAVFNFGAEPAAVEVDAAAVDTPGFADLERHESAALTGSKLIVQLPALGYRLFTVEPSSSR